MQAPSDLTATVPAVPSAPTRARARALVLRAAPVAGLAALILSGCASDAEQDTWKPKGPDAQRIQDLQWWIFLTAGIVGVIVFGVIGYSLFRFRDRGQEMPEQTHG